ncbi:MAG TPA: ATP-binding protein [Stellaceae bacterium]|nr:ATP-binding protein [Stellaceae bacterium]
MPADQQADYAAIEFQAGSVFTPGAPINERDLFSGRIQQIQSILQAISQRGYHAVMFGERGVGKTSLSNVLAAFLGRVRQNYLLPRVNCDSTDTFSSLWKKALQDIVVSKKKPGMGFNAEEIETAQSVVENLPDEITPDDVRRVLSDLSKGIVLVVVFDEFDRIQDRAVTVTMADTIKGLSDYSVSATIVLIGVADSIDDLIEGHQSVERAIVQVPMPRMSPQEIKQIVMTGLSRLKMGIAPEALDEIANLSQGLPYITHLLALQSVRAALVAKKMKIESSHVEVGMKNALDQWQQSIKTAYYQATKSQQPDNLFKEVLLACALAAIDELGYFTAASVRTPLNLITAHKYDIPTFARHLKEFSEHARGPIIERVGTARRLRYRFRSPLMRPYIVMRGFADGILSRETLKRIQEG